MPKSTGGSTSGLSAEERKRLTAIEHRRNGISKGRWIGTEDTCAICRTSGEEEFLILAIPSGVHGMFGHRADAVFIAASKSDVPWLVALVKRLAKEVQG